TYSPSRMVITISAGCRTVQVTVVDTLAGAAAGLGGTTRYGTTMSAQIPITIRNRSASHHHGRALGSSAGGAWHAGSRDLTMSTPPRANVRWVRLTRTAIGLHRSKCAVRGHSKAIRDQSPGIRGGIVRNCCCSPGAAE